MNSELEREAFAAGMRKAAEIVTGMAIFSAALSNLQKPMREAIISAIPADSKAALSTEAQGEPIAWRLVYSHDFNGRTYRTVELHSDKGYVDEFANPPEGYTYHSPINGALYGVKDIQITALYAAPQPSAIQAAVREKLEEAAGGASLGEAMVSLQKDELLEFKSQRIFELLAERDAILLDAKRYRWLRDQHWVESEATFRLSLSDSEFANEYHDKLDEAIDLALMESPHPIVEELTKE